MTDQNTTAVSIGKTGVPLPFFFIIITTYNRAHLLKRAINSLVLQTAKGWKAIIVDDGSTDDTHMQILPYLKSYPAIRYIKTEHSREAMSKNEGIWMSQGRFISFLDSDDEYAPDHLQYRKRILLQSPPTNFLLWRRQSNRFYNKEKESNDFVII